jgi:hypothetical protein
VDTLAATEKFASKLPIKAYAGDWGQPQAKFKKFTDAIDVAIGAM